MNRQEQIEEALLTTANEVGGAGEEWTEDSLIQAVSDAQADVLGKTWSASLAGLRQAGERLYKECRDSTRLKEASYVLDTLVTLFDIERSDTISSREIPSAGNGSAHMTGTSPFDAALTRVKQLRHITSELIRVQTIFAKGYTPVATSLLDQLEVLVMSWLEQDATSGYWTAVLSLIWDIRAFMAGEGRLTHERLDNYLISMAAGILDPVTKAYAVKPGTAPYEESIGIPVKAPFPEDQVVQDFNFNPSSADLSCACSPGHVTCDQCQPFDDGGDAPVVTPAD